MTNPSPQDKWLIRRRIFVTTLVFCASLAIYEAVWGPRDEFGETIISTLAMLAMAVIGFYTGGAVYEDTRK